jgi:hypothetical protein
LGTIGTTDNTHLDRVGVATSAGPVEGGQLRDKELGTHLIERHSSMNPALWRKNRIGPASVTNPPLKRRMWGKRMDRLLDAVPRENVNCSIPLGQECDIAIGRADGNAGSESIAEELLAVLTEGWIQAHRQWTDLGDDGPIEVDSGQCVGSRVRVKDKLVALAAEMQRLECDRNVASVLMLGTAYSDARQAKAVCVQYDVLVAGKECDFDGTL